MIRDAVLHLLNDQPLLVDLPEQPAPTDTVLLCTNMRTLSGTRPGWIDDSRSLFAFPYAVIRFVEIRPEGPPTPPTPVTTEGAAPPLAEPGPEADLEIDEELLRRVREV